MLKQKKFYFIALVVGIFVGSNSYASDFENFRSLLATQTLKRDIEQQVSRGLIGIGSNDFIKIVNAYNLNLFNWVSVGSGNGLVERALKLEPVPN